MPNTLRIHRFSLSPVSLAVALVATLGVAYIALVAVVMSYAALTIEFSQSVRNDEAAVATLESQYLAVVEAITTIDYAGAGYGKPVAEIFVPKGGGTGLR